MTTHAIATPGSRSLRDTLLAGLAGVVAPHAVAVGWGLVAAAVWGPGPRFAAFVDPTAARPAGYVIASLLFAVAAGALIGGGLALARARRPGVGPWGLWIPFAAGALLSVAYADARSLARPVVLLFIAASALGFRLGARR
jgi:hypothetical protein